MRGERRARAGVGRLALLAAAALVAVPGAAWAADQSVTIQNFAFNPATVTVDVGDTVTWTNADTAPHTATADDGSFDSGNLVIGQAFPHTFGTAGTFTYHCERHPDMEGTVVVRSASAATTAPPATNPPAPPPPRSGTTVARATTTTTLPPATTTTIGEPTTTSSTEQTVVAAADVDDDDDGGMGPAVGAAIALLVAAASGAAYLWWRRRGIPGAGAA